MAAGILGHCHSLAHGDRYDKLPRQQENSKNHQEFPVFHYTKNQHAEQQR
ncbi:MAG: hypothetical protein ABSF16_08835 [Terracidiphilus sp.]